MKGQVISIQPQIIHFNKQNVQTIKIINNTSTQLTNFFFCLYNVQKFSFNPESFSLAPNQHKLVQVTLRIKSTKSIAKQFAYLKSSQVNKRLTLLINNFQSPEVKTRQTQQGYSDMNTLSSRDYNELQNKALNKIIKQQQFFIAKNQKQFKQSASKTSQFSSSNLKQIEYVREIQSKNLYLQKQIQQMSLSYEKKCIQLERITNQNQFLQQQGIKLLKKLSQKQDVIKNLQSKIKTFEQKIQLKQAQFEQKLHQQNKSYQQCFKNYEEKIKQLEEMIQRQETNRSSSRLQIQSFNKKFKDEIQKKQSQLLELKNILEHHQNLIKQHQSNVTKLQSKNGQLEKINTNLREEIFVYKSKSQENNNQKMTKYLQIALESCKNENQLLKQSKTKMEKALEFQSNTFRQTNQANKQLQNNLNKITSQLQLIKKERQQLQIMNITLKQQKQSLLKDIEIKQRENHQVQQNKISQNLVFQKQIQKLREENLKLIEKVKKYKSQAKKQLKSINDTAFDQLKRIHQEKKVLTKKVAELQQTISNFASHDGKSRTKSKSKIQYVGFAHSLQHQRPKSHQHHECQTKLVGIKNQRKELQQSRANSLRQNSNFETVYNQLMQLRQVQNYVKQQQDKFVQLFNLEQLLNTPYYEEKNQPMRPIYRCIKFFKVIETKLRGLQQKADQSIYVSKQNQFMKGRLAQIERKQSQMQHQSILNNNPHKTAVNDQNNTSSILLNRSQLNFTNPVEMLDFMKDEMKKQYKKLNQALKFSEEKYQILKKKIYREYRSRIIQLLANKKDKQQIIKIQSTIQRFVQGLSNTSHKQAILNKQIKVKQFLKLDNSKLKHRLYQAEHLLKQKNGYCNRQPLKVYTCASNSAINIKQEQYIENLKLATQLLTQNAQNQRLKQQLQILRQDLNDIRQEMDRMNEAYQGKDEEIIKLKKNQIELQNNYQDQLKKQNQILENTRQKYLNSKNSSSKYNTSSTLKESQRQVQALKQQLDKKTSQLRQYKQKEKNWEEFVQESNRTQSKQNKIESDYKRIEQNLFQIKESNLNLKKQNQTFLIKIQELQKDVQRKKAYINLLKGQDQQNRIKTHKNNTIDLVQVQKLKEQVKKLTDELHESKQQLSRYKKKKEKDYAKLENQYNSSKNASILHIKSLQSVVRAILQTIRKLYSSLKIIIKKKGLSYIGKQFQAPSQLIQIDAIKIYEQFQTILQALQN